MRVRYTASAERDVVSALADLEAALPGAARQLAARIKGVEDLLVQFPKLGTATRFPWLRRIKVHGFPYLVFYQISESTVRILAVRHGPRRPFDDIDAPGM